MKFSVFTPTHNLMFIKEAADSLLNQTYEDFEWIVLLNNGPSVESFWGVIGADRKSDSRIRVIQSLNSDGNVGSVKGEACSHCEGDIMVELDHDDILLPYALERLHKVFSEKENVVYAYSNYANFDRNWNPYIVSSVYGWENRDFEYNGIKMSEGVAPEPLPTNILNVWFGPNHVRAWRSITYNKVGGFDESMSVGDDHDLYCRMYTEGDFYHIDECLYLYRIHGENTWLKNSQAIQDIQWNTYDRYLYKIIGHWSKLNNKLQIDVCSHGNAPNGLVSVDLSGADVNTDLNERWPFADNSVGLIRAQDAIEHLKDPIHTMNEAYRVLCHGGMFLIEVPSTDGRGAWQDPTHVSKWNENSFWYYTKSSFSHFIPDYNGRFHARRLLTYFPSEWHEQNNISYVRAHLVALKDGPKIHGLIEI